MKAVFYSLCFCFLSAFFEESRSQSASAKLAEEAKELTVAILKTDEKGVFSLYGSGVVIADSFVVSVRHVVETPKNEKLFVKIWKSGLVVPASVFITGDDIFYIKAGNVMKPEGLVVLKVNHRFSTHAVLADTLWLNQSIRAIGFPWPESVETEPMLWAGIVSVIKSYSVICDVNVAPGISGGGLWSSGDKLYLIGIFVGLLPNRQFGGIIAAEAFNIGEIKKIMAKGRIN